MKKIYLHLMALICLFLCGGVNVWATVYTWTGDLHATTYYKSATTKSKAVEIGHHGGQGMYDNPESPTKVYYYSTNPGYNRLYAAITVQYGKPAYLFTNYSGGGFVTLYLQGYDKTDQHPYAIIKQNGTIITSCTTKTRTQNEVWNETNSTAISFKMEQGKEYQITMPEHTTSLHIKKVVFYTPDEVNEIILDETATKATNDNKVAANYSRNYKFVSSIRTIKKDQWNTFCFPINFTNDELIGNFGCSNVFEMNSYSSSDKTIAFDAKTTYSAGKPCLIQPSQDIVNPSFMIQRSVSLTASTQKAVTGLSFVGIYGAEDLYTYGDDTSTKFYMKNDGYLVYPTDPNNGSIKGLRAYFECDGVSSLAKGMTFAFNDTQTGIKTVEFDVLDNDGRVYSIDGRYVGNSTNNLTRGIYIQNGRKFVVK